MARAFGVSRPVVKQQLTLIKKSGHNLAAIKQPDDHTNSADHHRE